mgnify:CR=1 FL=1|jgi:Uma2 family endonuclease/predicted DNA-binding transcriptional regulator AlpA
MNNKDLITAHVLAEALDLSVETIWRYTRNDKIPYVKLGERQYRYNLQEVMAALTGENLREKAPDYITDSRSYTYQDYLALPEEPGVRYEVLDGQLIQDPAPQVLHQSILIKLLLFLAPFFEKYDPKGRTFCAPLDVTLGDRTVVQPDIIYIPGTRRDIIKETRIDGAPALVVEILSPVNRRKDRLLKLKLFQAAGIEHLWLVDPEDRTVECMNLRDGAYILAASGLDDQVLEHPDFPGLSIPLADLWHQ